jgi:S1-C subfamily serine protease
VTSAPVGSPAYESGLRDGDVIVKVGGQAVKNVSEVRDLVGLANDDGEHAIEMEILRQKKTQRLTLKW